MLSVSITRERLGELAKPLIDKSLASVKRVLRDAKVKPDEVKGVVMVGGSTRMPAVRSNTTMHQLPNQAPPDTESARLAQYHSGRAAWKRWGPYLAERQWGTVREDYSANGDCWNSFPHDQARSRAYRWGEDGLLGICDDECRLCFALALWNGKDPWKKYPMTMLSARAVTSLGRAFAGEVMYGCYEHDEADEIMREAEVVSVEGVPQNPARCRA